MANGKTLLKGSGITVKALEGLGVGVVFAYPGGPGAADLVSGSADDIITG